MRTYLSGSKLLAEIEVFFVKRLSCRLQQRDGRGLLLVGWGRRRGSPKALRVAPAKRNFNNSIK